MSDFCCCCCCCVAGYQRELTYKHDDGSYSAFGSNDPSGNTWWVWFRDGETIPLLSESFWLPMNEFNAPPIRLFFLELRKPSLHGQFTVYKTLRADWIIFYRHFYYFLRLTAFVMKSFGGAKKYIFIDQTSIDEAKNWLGQQQKTNGCFASVGQLIHIQMMVRTEEFCLHPLWPLWSFTILHILYDNLCCWQNCCK